MKNPFDFSWLLGGSPAATDVPDIFPLSLTRERFLKGDIFSTYSKILTDTVERTLGITDKSDLVLWDNCVSGNTRFGLVSLLAQAMTEKGELFLVYKKELDILRKADAEEAEIIKKDYENSNKSAMGVYINFKDYKRTELLEIYSVFEFCTLGALNKSLNLAKAIQIKTKDLRSSMSLSNAGVAIAQAKGIASGLSLGRDVILDAGDTIETATIDTAPAEKSIDFVVAKKSEITGLPKSYFDGVQTEGIGSSGENDARATSRGLKQYFVSIIRPVFDALFSSKVTFRSDDARQISSACEVLKSLNVVDNELMSTETKRALVANAFDLNAKEEAKKIEAEQAAEPPQPAGEPEVPEGKDGDGV